MITNPADLKPDTSWGETIWAHTPVEVLVDHRSKARLCVATLLPFRKGQPDWEGFERSIRWMLACADAYDVEIVFVLNADTGFIFQLSEKMYAEVLSQFRASFPGRKMICGATATESGGGKFRAEWYRPHIEIAQSFEAVEVMIMTSRGLSQLEPRAQRDAYFEIAELIRVPAIVHALEPAFLPWARPFGPWLFHQLSTHEKFTSGKISTLDEPHFLYWAAMCRDLNPDFLPHSGDDYGIASAIKMGLPLLIGAGVSACPLICAAKKMWTETPFDSRVYKLLEAIQSLEDAVFRLDKNGSSAGYKHSTAVVLKHLGLLESSEIHPDCADRRGEDEEVVMRAAMRRPTRMAEKLGIDLWQP